MDKSSFIWSELDHINSLLEWSGDVQVLFFIFNQQSSGKRVDFH